MKCAQGEEGCCRAHGGALAMERDWHYETGDLAERMRAFPWGAKLLTPSATSQEGGMR